MRPEDLILQNMPMSLEWAGWRSDTHTMQRCGWRFALEQPGDYGRGEFRLALKHLGMDMVAITEWIDLCKWNHLKIRGNDRQMVVRVIHVSSRDITFQSMGGPISATFNAVDVTPHMTKLEHMSLSHLPAFESPVTPEFIIPEQSVPELMQLILDKQEPARQEYLKTQARTAPVTHHAQIISLTG